MRPDAVLRCDGMRILTEHLGLVEAERFITLILRDKFDYTQWRQDRWEGVPLETFLENAKKYSENQEKNVD